MRQIKKLSFVLLIILSLVLIFNLLPKILAGDTSVTDLTLKSSVDGKKINLTVTDKNMEDTKVVIPLEADLTFNSSGQQIVGVTEDIANHQVVIDWVEGQKKEVTLQLMANKVGGEYALTANTVRNEQPVSSEICYAKVKDETEGVNKTIESSTDSQEKKIENEKVDPSISNNDDKTETSNLNGTNTIATGNWGTAPWKLDSDGVLYIESGELSERQIEVGGDKDNILGSNLPNIKKIVFNGKVKLVPKSQQVFSFFANLVEIENIDKIDTSQVTDMGSMFYSCQSLQSIDLSSFDTSQVTDMGSMFYACKSLQSIDLSSFDTSQVTNMSFMFFLCSSLPSINLSSFDTSQVTSMNSMFERTLSLLNIDLNNFDTSQVTSMNFMFDSCYSLSSLDLSRFDTSQVTSMKNMFTLCSSLQSLDLSSFNTSQVTDMGSMFYNCRSLLSLDLSNFDTSQVTNMSGMFNSCSSLTSIDLSNFDTSQVTDMGKMFEDDNFKNIKLGKKINSIAGSSLKEITPSSSYTGKWQNIGQGTESNPTGKFILTSTELMSQYQSNMADTYVWQPKKAPKISQKISAINTIEDGTNYIGDQMKFSINISNSVTGTTTSKTVDTILIPKILEVQKDSIKVSNSKGQVLQNVLIEESKENEGAKIIISGEGLNLKGEDNIVVNYNGTFIGAGDGEVSSNITYQDEWGNDQTPNIATLRLDSKVIGLEDNEATIKPMDTSKFDTTNPEFPNLTTFTKNEKIEMLYDITNIKAPRNETLSNFYLWFTYENWEKIFNIDVDSFYIKSSTTSNWKQIDKSSIDDTGNMGGNPCYLINKLDSPLKIGEHIMIKFSVTAKMTAPLKKNALGVQGVLKESGDISSWNSLTSKSGELRFEKVPAIMSFNESKISNRTTQVQRQDHDWKITVEDTRIDKKNWRVTAKMGGPFKDDSGEALKPSILVFKKKNNPDQWITEGSEVDVFDGTSTSKTDFYEVSWHQDEGPLLQIAPGVVKAKEYKGSIQWNLVDAPV